MQAFAFFGGVPQSILYDNTKIAVARILGDGKRQRTRVFSELQSHYLFKDRFGRPGKGNDKGKVEGLVGYARRNFLVPIPVFADFEALNAHLAGLLPQAAVQIDCAAMTGRSASGWSAILPRSRSRCRRPTTPARRSRAASTRCRWCAIGCNDYSVPTAYGHRKVLVRGYVHEVVIACGAEIIARHPRSYEREDFVFDPLHYLALIEQKTNALDQAAPLAGWKLPEEFATLRRLLEARMGKQGKREFVQVLRLMEVFKIDDVAAAVRDAIARGAIGFDAVKHLVLCRIERRPPRLMPRFDGRKELHVLLGPKSRKQQFPGASFAFLVHVALNIARAVAQLHEHDVCVGDMNDRGILVGADGTVRFIDCDSFQVAIGSRLFPV